MSRALAQLPRSGRRAVLYLRQSQEREDSESITNQEYLGREYCRQHGYDVVAVHVDRISGRKWDTRPGVIATMSLIENQLADVIILWKWSRLSRSRLHWAVAADRVLTAGGRIESVTEPLDTSTASGRFARGVMTEYAAFQSEQIGEVWRETLDRRVREGKPPTGRARFGYIWNRETDTYSHDPKTAPAVAELYRRVVAGQGQASITRWLNQEGHRTRHDRLWQVSNLTRYLDRGFAAGKIISHGQLFPGAHEPIVDEETWEAYLACRAASVPRPRGSLRMASGLLRCMCGGPLTTVRSTGGNATYSCGRRGRGDDGCEYRVSIGRHLIEQSITEWIGELPAAVEMIKAAEQRQTEQRARSIEDRGAIARLISRAEGRLASLTLKLVDGVVTDAAYTAAAQPLNAELDMLRERYLRSAPRPANDPFARIPDLVSGWAESSPPAQNRIARQLIGVIRVHPKVSNRPGDWRKRIEIVPLWEHDA